MSKNKEVLLPCPCCGGKADIHIISKGIGFVYCLNCDLATNSMEIAEAIELWNTRPSCDMSKMRELLEKAQKDAEGIQSYAHRSNETIIKTREILAIQIQFRIEKALSLLDNPACKESLQVGTKVKELLKDIQAKCSQVGIAAIAEEKGLQHRDTEYIAQACKEVCDLITKALSQLDSQPKSPWISVEKPPKEIRFIFVKSDTNLDVCDLDDNRALQIARLKNYYTHWMPAPELPKQGKKCKDCGGKGKVSRPHLHGRHTKSRHKKTIDCPICKGSGIEPEKKGRE